MRRPRRAFDFDALTPAFATKFTSYLLHEARLTDNTIAKALTRLKCFLRFAHERGFVDRADFKFLKWKKQEPAILTLTLPEVQDLFLLACYTSLRYSDLVALRPEHLQNEPLRVCIHKTRDVVIIPVRPAARQLLQRLFAGELRPISNQQMNKMLKEIGERAGLAAPVERVRYRGGQRQTETFRKWECLSCHTARRTYTTLALEQRLRMRTTGHRTWAVFKRYVAISDDTVEKEFAAVYGGGALGEIQRFPEEVE
jgi:integrase